MLDSTVRKNGQRRCSSWQAGQLVVVAVHPGLQRRAGAVPAGQHDPGLRPAEHPRDGPQVGDLVAGLARRRAAADVQLAELLDRGRRPEPVDEAGRLVHQRPVGLLGAAGEVVEQRVGRLGVVPEALDVEQAGLQGGGDQRLEVAPGQVGVGVLGRDHLALLGDPQRARRPRRAAAPGSPRSWGRRRGRPCRRGRGRAAAGCPRARATSTRSSSARYSAQLAAR